MKTAAKITSVLMAAVIASGMTGCGKDMPDITELQKNKGDMLVIRSYPQGPFTEAEYEDSVFRMSVTYDGYANNPNHVNDPLVKMSDDDYMKIYEFCVEATEDNRFEDYKEDVCDGETYAFVYYDTEGEAHVIYRGYCYENDELQDIMYTIRQYSLDRSDIVT